MKIYTSYFAKLKKIKEADKYLPISIARYTPDGIDVHSILTFAPSEKLLRDIKVGYIDEKEYERIYREEMSHIDFQQVYDIFSQLSKANDDRDPVLLCYEKSGDFCHRHIFASLMAEKTGIEIKELDI